MDEARTAEGLEHLEEVIDDIKHRRECHKFVLMESTRRNGQVRGLTVMMRLKHGVSAHDGIVSAHMI